MHLLYSLDHLKRWQRLRSVDTVSFIHSQALLLFNGDGKEYQAVLQQSDKQQATVLVENARQPRRESQLHITLGQGISRRERMDFVLQKSVELGVAAITPVRTSRSQVQLSGTRLDKRLSHWRGVIRSACEQSGRLYLPSLSDPASLEDWCTARQEHSLQLVLDPTATLQLSDITPAMKIRILIGPEGGLAMEEIQKANNSGFTRIRLGPRTLRTETAALATLAAIQALWGDLSG